MIRSIQVFLVAVLTLFAGNAALAFCGFYVAKADSDLFNQASQVVLVRDKDRTVLTMANDYQGDASEFAIVIPVPTLLQREQIHVTEPALIEHLDAYTAPRLVEYFDSDPCVALYEESVMSDMVKRSMPAAMEMEAKARQQGVTIEASYTVGEYDILILSAKESNGLVRWLRDNDYKLPDGADRVVGSYVKQGLKFFVAKVNLKAHEQLGYSYLRPLQVAYESPRFMLPIRLGTLNARGKQDLYVYALTRTGRVETSNYRTVRMPSNVNVPEFVQGEFGDFYRAMFKKQLTANNDRAVFLEYAWDMNWCDPCAADPLSNDELRELGVYWVDESAGKQMRGKMAAKNVFVTRLHLRYDSESFPDDLKFHETGDRQNYQGRYVVQHAFKGDIACAAGENYRKSLVKRRQREAEQLASLTGWELSDILAKMPKGSYTPPTKEPKNWWEKLWNRG
ncbi:MAG: DUF2330 domain-containing protein [Pseudomonadota bacterium]